MKSRLRRAGVSKVEIERAIEKVTVTIYTARPGVVIGRKGSEVDKLRDELSVLVGREVIINIQEVSQPELDAFLVAEQIAQQLEARMPFRRAMKRAIQATMKAGALGIKIECSGRLSGAEIARSEKYTEGRVPLATLRANIDFAKDTAFTTYGTIGVKVWIFKGEILG